MGSTICSTWAMRFFSGRFTGLLLKAKLEPYLGFLHSVQFGEPSLVCDLEELYRCHVDDYVIQFCQGLREKDFTTMAEDAFKNRKRRRE